MLSTTHSATPYKGLPHISFHKPYVQKGKDICFKIFIVVSIVFAAVLIIAGALALMACKSMAVGGLSALNKLNVIGEVNSYVMLCGGLAFFVLGNLAWSYELHKNI